MSVTQCSALKLPPASPLLCLPRTIHTGWASLKLWPCRLPVTYALETITNPTTDRNTSKTCNPLSADDVILLVAYTSRTEDPDVTHSSIVAAINDPLHTCAGINLLKFESILSFNPVDKCTKIT
ncbi:hypothetical protein NP233_g7388 [Leucocoprinus birnbaumii]|uniref:Uncharacterized protein n=1 Tax=Leucocoprinus birnbaumii TaxID=56174 RepID=A0AAD5YP30_9AGAR|nr:hypothetical protein NP233_g7388 [Leucocoprinus birnbaumii]